MCLEPELEKQTLGSSFVVPLQCLAPAAGVVVGWAILVASNAVVAVVNDGWAVPSRTRFDYPSWLAYLKPCHRHPGQHVEMDTSKTSR